MPRPRHKRTTRRPHESSARVVQHLAGTSTAQLAVNVRKKQMALSLMSVLRSRAAHKMVNRAASTAAMVSEVHSSSTLSRTDSCGAGRATGMATSAATGGGGGGGGLATAAAGRAEDGVAASTIPTAVTSRAMSAMER